MFGYGTIKNKLFRRADLAIVAFFLAAALAAFLVQARFGGGAAVILIEQEGRETCRLPYGREASLRLESPSGGYNLITVTADGVSVAEADCPDQRCVKQGRIREGGQVIVCLPHRLTVRILSEKGDGLDAVVQ